MWEKKRKVISDFSLYTFSAFAMNKALRMRKKIKYMYIILLNIYSDEP